MPEFSDLFLKKSGFVQSGCEGELDITPSRTAIWDEAAVSQE